MSQYPEQNNGGQPPQYGSQQPPQYQGGVPQYQGDSPYYQGGGGPRGDLSARPQSVRTGMMLLWIALAVSLVLSIVSVTTMDVEALVTEQDASGVDTAALAGTTRAVTYVFVAVWYAVLALFVHFAGKGRNWARIILTVLAVLMLLGTLATLLSGAFLSVIGSILFIVGVVFLYRKDATAWYQAHTAAKRGF